MSLFYRAPKESIKQRALRVLQGVGGLFDSLVLLFTLGAVGSSLQLSLCRYRTRQWFIEQKNAQK